MNKLYRTLDLYAAWLVEVTPESRGGIKNIIGLKVQHKGENLFYSLLDDCFFRVFPSNDIYKYEHKGTQGCLLVEIYEYQAPPYELKTFGMELYNYIKKDYITKQELIEIKKDKDWLFGYQSDFSYKLLKTDTNVDYEDSLLIDDYIIDTVEEYEEKIKRPLSYEDDCIYGPSARKLSIK